MPHRAVAPSVRVLLCFIGTLGCLESASGDPLVAIGYDDGLELNQVFTVDPATGQGTLNQNYRFPGGTWRAELTADAATGYAYAAGGRGVSRFDLRTGQSSAFLDQAYFSIDATGDGRLFGLFNPAPRQFELYSIDYDGRDEARIATVNGTLLAGSFTVDRRLGAAYFVAGVPSSRLVSIDLTSGKVRRVTLPFSVETDSGGDGRLFGYRYNSTTDQNEVYRVDPATGELELVAQSPAPGSRVGSSFSVDAERNEAYLLSATGRLYAFDLETGEVRAVRVGEYQNIQAPAAAAYLVDAQTPGQLSLAEAIEASAAAGIDMDELVAALIAIAPSEVPAALEALQPTQASMFVRSGLVGARVQQAHVSSRVAQNRGGEVADVASVSGLDAALAATASEADAYATFLDGPDEAQATHADENDGREDRWHAFAIGSVQLGDFENQPGAFGYDFTTAAITLGLDRRVADAWSVGLFVGYASNHSDFFNDSGEADAETARLGAFVSFDRGPWHVGATVSGGHHWYDLEREVVIGNLRRTATADPTGVEFAIAGDLSYDLSLPAAVTLTPSAQLAYTHLDIDAYTEEGAGVVGLAVDEQAVNSLVGTIGVQARRTWEFDRFEFTPALGVAWRHEFRDTSDTVSARFAGGAGAAFAFETPDVTDNALVLSAGATIENDGRCSVFADYAAELGGNDYTVHTVRLGVRVPF